MIDFFIRHASSFLTVGLTALAAILLKTAARRYADREDP